MDNIGLSPVLLVTDQTSFSGMKISSPTAPATDRRLYATMDTMIQGPPAKLLTDSKVLCATGAGYLRHLSHLACNGPVLLRRNHPDSPVCEFVSGMKRVIHDLAIADWSSTVLKVNTNPFNPRAESLVTSGFRLVLRVGNVRCRAARIKRRPGVLSRPGYSHDPHAQLVKY